MKKLSKLKLKEFHQMDEREMKSIIGGYNVYVLPGYETTGTCCFFIPEGHGSGNYPNDINAYYVSVNHKKGMTVCGVSRNIALASISGILGAKWCCDNCGSASWL